jgi:hypothetical protein
MSSIFKGGPGLLLQPINSGAQSGPLVTIGSGLFDNIILMCSGFEMTRVQDVEYQKTLSSVIYGFAFGEGPGKIQISGYAFLSNISDGTTIGRAVSQINEFYSQNNVSSNMGSPVSISVDSSSFNAYLEIMSIVMQSNATNVGSFTMTFTVLN